MNREDLLTPTNPNRNGHSFWHATKHFLGSIFTPSRPSGTPQVSAIGLGKEADLVAGSINLVPSQIAREQAKRGEVFALANAHFAECRGHGKRMQELERQANLLMNQQINPLRAQIAAKQAEHDQLPRLVWSKESNSTTSNADQWKYAACWTLLIALACWTWINTSRTLLPSLQSWPACLTITALLLVAPLFLKLGIDFGFREPATRRRVWLSIVALSAVALVVYMVALFRTYFVPLSMAEIKAGSTRAWSKGVLIVSQMLFELGLGGLLINVLSEISGRLPQPNPKRLALVKDIAELTERLNPLLTEHARAVDELDLLAATQRSFADKCHLLYLINCEEAETDAVKREQEAERRAEKRAAIHQSLGSSATTQPPTA